MTDTEMQRIKAICDVAGVDDIGKLSDGFHTFDSLYEQRLILFAALVKAYKDKAWKSYRHEDGEYCFGGGWFIVGIDTPEGSYTYHYENKHWDMFDCIDLPRAKHWDGHTEADAETRLMSLEPKHTPERTETHECDYKTNHGFMWLCPECGLIVHSDFTKCVRCGKVRPSAERCHCADVSEDAFDTNVGDMISRQAVLDILYLDPGIDEIREKMIKALPSAEPEIIRCCKCIHWKQDTVRQNSNDVSWWNEAVCEKHSDEIWTAWRDADWYCADAERRTDE